MVSPVNVIASPSQFASGVPFKQKAAQGITWIDQNDPSTGAARPDRSSTPNRATFLRSWRSGRDRLRLSGTVWPDRALSHFGCDDRGAGDCSMQSTRFSHYGRISSHLHGDDHEHHNLHGRHKFDSHYQRVSGGCRRDLSLLPLEFWPVTSTTSSTQLVTSVDQCDGIVTGGGSNVYCNVIITNNVPVGTSTTTATVDQCIGSATGGGSTETCAPSGSTDQCHDHPVQWFGYRGWHVQRRAHGELHCDGEHVSAARNRQSVQWHRHRRWQRRDLHDHADR